MSNTSPDAIQKTRPWPFTSDAQSRLAEEIARMRADLTFLTGQGLEEGIVELPVARTSRRLETFKDFLARSEIVDRTGCVAIGRRATLREEGRVAMTYEVVLPGDSYPEMRCISADSALGEAILGAKVGDVVDVIAPDGPLSVMVVAID
jgi:transcription elongation GreA/GreB family factor